MIEPPNTPTAVPDMPELPKPGGAPAVSRRELGKSFTDNNMSSPFAEDSYGYQLGHRAMSMLKGPNAFTRTFDHGPAMGAASGAATLGGLGYLGANAFNMLTPGGRQMDTGRAGMLAALIGALMGGTRGHYQTMGKQGSLAAVPRLIDQADLDPAIEGSLYRAMQTMTPDEMQQVASILQTYTGALAGAALARFLFGRNPLASLLGTIGGGYAGHSLLGSNPIRNVQDLY